MNADLLERARNGDETAFAKLVGAHRRELEVHCYRMLGSAQDAEDALQETMLAAWRNLGQFEERASVRTWLYRIATTRCLNARRSRNRRLRTSVAGLSVTPPDPTRLGEIVWLEPYPDLLLDLSDPGAGPEARYEQRESISLAFVKALQLLPARQRAALVLRDVLGFHAAEVASILDSTEESVTSALKRARAALARRNLRSEGDMDAPTPGSRAETQLAQSLTSAWESGDVDGVVALLAEDVWLTMPPMPLEYQGRDLVAAFLAAVAFRDGRTYQFVPTRANGSPAFGVYLRDRDGGDAHAVGLIAVTFADNCVTSLTRFENAVMTRFGLPRSLPDTGRPDAAMTRTDRPARPSTHHVDAPSVQGSVGRVDRGPLDPGGAMEDKLRLEGLTLTVADVRKSVDFYGGLLGLEVAYVSEPAFAMIKVGDATIGLLSVEEARKEGAEKTTSAQNRAIHVEFSTDDLDAVYEGLTAKGVVFHEPPHDEPWERVMTALDPDGYSVEIAQGRRGQDGAIWNAEDTATPGS